MAISKVACAAAVVFCSLRPGAGLARGRSGATLEVDRNRPISKVITLLKDMNKQLEKEADEDQEVYSKMACWCTTNDKEKTKAIAEAEARIEDLGHKIEGYTALSAQLGTEVKKHEAEVATNQKALATATALRQKQLAEFNGEEKDALESISALKAAVTALQKHQGASALVQISSALRQVLPRAHFLTEGQRRTASSFLQSGDYFDAEPTFKQSYAPQSGQIFGILAQMLETFENNLAASQKEEQENQKAYEDLKAAKEEEIASGQAQIDAKSQSLAETDQKNARAKEDLEDTTKSLRADEQFLAMLKEKCAMTDKEWEERQNTRRLEMEAVSKALEVLSGDDAHDLFGKTFNPALVQTGTSRNRREAAARLLEGVAKRVGSPKLSTLAMSVKLDAFERVKKAISDMVQELAKEKQDEIKHKDFCVDEFNTNQLQTEKKTRHKTESQATIEDLEMTIKGLTEAIDALTAEVAEMQVQMKRAGEDREIENKQFQSTVSDQRDTQRLLKKALKFLENFYGEQKKAFVQQDPVGPPPPAGFDSYRNNGSSGGVMQLIGQIVSDAKAMENEAIRSEADAQKAYEDFVKDTNMSIETKSEDMVNKKEERAKTRAALVEEKKTMESLSADLEQLANLKGELHSSCDFVMRNFAVRQQARDEEIEALKQASAILSGAKFD